ncbi:MAG: hypothetical protein ABL932_24885, partial [Terricaulis sp.]
MASKLWRLKMLAAASVAALMAACATPETPEDIEALAWGAATSQDRPESYQTYLNVHGASPHAEAARQRIAELMVLEREAWGRARQVNTEASYDEYLNRFGWGANAPEADQRRAALAAPRLAAQERADWGEVAR